MCGSLLCALHLTHITCLIMLTSCDECIRDVYYAQVDYYICYGHSFLHCAEWRTAHRDVSRLWYYPSHAACPCGVALESPGGWIQSIALETTSGLSFSSTVVSGLVFLTKLSWLWYVGRQVGR
jgi:hypothetical protein